MSDLPYGNVPLVSRNRPETFRVVHEPSKQAVDVEIDTRRESSPTTAAIMAGMMALQERWVSSWGAYPSEDNVKALVDDKLVGIPQM